MAPDTADDDSEFGVSVAIDKDTIVVGAWRDQGGKGSVFVSPPCRS